MVIITTLCSSYFQVSCPLAPCLLFAALVIQVLLDKAPPHSSIYLASYHTAFRRTMDLKCRISTPLEAGTSILDAHRLPLHLMPALEYTSKRLSSKGLHVTLVVVRKDYQLPNANADFAAATEGRHVPSLPTPPRSPEFPDPTGGVPRQNSFKSLSLSGSGRDFSQWRKVCSLPRKASIASVLDGTIGRRWPLTPNTPTNVPKTPATPTTPVTPASFVSAASSATASSSMRDSLESQGPCLRMLHTTALSPKAHNLVTATLARATRRFKLTNALTAVEPSSYHIPPIVLHGSILQNEVLFSSEGLTLLSMDHLYTFKSALAHYTTGRTEPGSEFRLEDAVDDLRRYVLSSAGGRRRLLKSVLVQAYDWLGQINDFALSDVTEMYCRAYGGITGDCGVEDDVVKPVPTPASTESAAKSTALTPYPVANIRLSPKPDKTFAVENDTQQVEDLPGTPDAPTTSEAPMPKGEVHPVADDLEIVQKLANTPVGKPLNRNNDAEKQDSVAPTQPPRLVLQTQPQNPFLKTPSPRASPKASLPALRVQTSFTQPVKPKPRRRETPVPLPTQQHLRKKKSKPINLATDTVPLSAVAKPADASSFQDTDISIEIHADDDPSIDEAYLTEFEDADLTARPPPSATCGRTPVEPIWSGIDEILGSSRRPTKRGGMMLMPLSHQRRRSSSLVLPSQHDDVGPATPNGYDDISPITRGEWGFLMVSDPFRTKTAAVSCV